MRSLYSFMSADALSALLEIQLPFFFKLCNRRKQHMGSSNPVVVIFLPVLYILGACLSLLQLSVGLTLISKGIAYLKSLDFFQHSPLLPMLLSMNEYMTKIFG